MNNAAGLSKFFNRHWEKMLLWALLAGLLFLLRPFLLLIFNTFLITFLTKRAVDELVRRTRLGHRVATALVFLVFVGALGLVTAWVGPRLIVESNRIVTDFAGEGEQQTREKTNRFVESIVVRFAGADKGKAFIGSERFTTLMDGATLEVTKFTKAALPALLQNMIHLIRVGWEFLVALLLSIIFSFMLVSDWQRIGRAMEALENSRIRTFYLGVAPHLRAFANVLGRALGAQALIAAVNTVLTAAGLWFLDVPNIALLSTLVFVCGFIPILGTLLSSIPIVLFGVQAGGLMLGAQLVGLIAVIHAVEAYVLNPRITGGFLRIHPLMVLVLLLVGERFFGIWGMVIGVPIGYYIINVLTMPEDATAEDKESKR